MPHGPQPNRRKVDVERALDLHLNHGLSYAQMAPILGVHPSAIHKRIKHLLPNNDTQYYQNHRADILSHVQLQLLSQVDTRRLKKVSSRDAVISYGILYDKERLERGQSTANTDMRILSATLKELEAQEKELRESLGDLGVTDIRDDGDCKTPSREKRNEIKEIK